MSKALEKIRKAEKQIKIQQLFLNFFLKTYKTLKEAQKHKNHSYRYLKLLNKLTSPKTNFESSKKDSNGLKGAKKFLNLFQKL